MSTVNSSVQDFEQAMRRELQRFSASKGAQHPKPKPRRYQAERPLKGYTVTLGVKTKRLELETPFTVQTSSISKLESRIEAERKAREAGWPIVSHVIDWQMASQGH